MIRFILSDILPIIDETTRKYIKARKLMLEITTITKTFGSCDCATTALKNVSLTIEDGSFTVLLSASGSASVI